MGKKHGVLIQSVYNMFQPVNKLRYALLRLLKLAEDVYLNSEIWPPSNSTPVEGSVGPTLYSPLLLPPRLKYLQAVPNKTHLV
jgi:hypothetical protein